MRLQQALRDFVDAGLRGLRDRGLVDRPRRSSRLAGTHIEVALFTNFTQDHLDYHGDMAAYWKAKRALFAWPGLKAAVLNIDDAHGAELAGTLRAAPLDLWTCSTQRPGAAARRRACTTTTAAWPSTLREGDARCCRCAAR